MKKFSILDCTLRDGGYINNWAFGREKITGIVSELEKANIDIIECGFLRDKTYNPDVAVFNCIRQIAPLIAPKRADAMYVAMIALGDIAPEKVLPREKDSIDGIRLTFHKHEWMEARNVAQQLKDKGYQVFIQPVGTTSYSDRELLNLIDAVNELQPFAFYLVDTLGQLYSRELLRFSTLIDHNLNRSIAMGFHSHNNLQLSLSNALELMHQDFSRHLIIDTSIYGMGRGVGNLPTELLAQYVNENMQPRYQLTPLLVIAERYLMSIYAEQRWGYDLPYFISAAEKCHPNYASYLMKKETLNIEAIAQLLRRLPAESRDLFHKDVIARLYHEFQDNQVDDADVLKRIRALVAGRSVLLLAPGATIGTHFDDICAYYDAHNPVVIAVNFTHPTLAMDALFISSRKRLAAIKNNVSERVLMIATSNLRAEVPENAHLINYSSYLGEGTDADNAGAMLIRLLGKCGVKDIALAGFDGFAMDVSSNYYVDSFKRKMERTLANEKNTAIAAQLRSALTGIPYCLITPTRYEL